MAAREIKPFGSRQYIYIYLCSSSWGASWLAAAGCPHYWLAHFVDRLYIMLIIYRLRVNITSYNWPYGLTLLQQLLGTTTTATNIASTWHFCIATSSSIHHAHININVGMNELNILEYFWNLLSCDNIFFFTIVCIHNSLCWGYKS